MATKAKKAPPAASKPAAKAAAVDPSCPAEGMEAPPARTGPHPQVKGGQRPT